MRILALLFVCFSFATQARRLQHLFHEAADTSGQAGSAFIVCRHPGYRKESRRNLCGVVRKTTTHPDSGRPRRPITMQAVELQLDSSKLDSIRAGGAVLADNPQVLDSGLPRFDSINVDQLEAIFEALVSGARKDFAKLEKELQSQSTSSYEATVEAIEKLQGPLDYTWRMLAHLTRVDAASPIFQSKSIPENTNLVYEMKASIDQSRPLYDALSSLDAASLSTSQQRLVQSTLKNMHLKGVALSDKSREELNTIQLRAKYLQLEFSKNVRDSGEAFASGAVQVGRSALLKNRPIIQELLAGRQQIAKMLGFANYAELSLSTKGAPDVASVERFTATLAEWGATAAEREIAEVVKFANIKGNVRDIHPSILNQFSERLKAERFYSEAALRDYLYLPNVLDGLFGLASKLFGVSIIRDDDAAERVYPDDMFFRVVDDATGDVIGYMFLNPYERPGNKMTGCWQETLVGRSKALGTRPIVFMTCEASRPSNDQPSLLNLNDVRQFFHEFGHALQSLLTHVDEGGAAGTKNIELDHIEFPSLFMEYWLYHKPTFDSFAKHWETGEPLSPEIFDKVKAGSTFQAGMRLLQQLKLQAADLELHTHDFTTGKESPFEVYRRIAQKFASYTGHKAHDMDEELCGFQHVFAEQQPAGYYTYYWSEMYAADAFAAFEEAGLDDDEALAAIGRRFRETVLGRGGSQHPAEVFRDFRGREVNFDAWRRYSGLVSA